MPRMDAAIYAAHMDSVLKLAKRKGGVSRPQIIDELNVTRAVASGLIEKCELEHARTEGRTEYYVPPNGAKAEPEPVVAKQSKPAAAPGPVAVPESAEAAPPSDDEVAELDAQIIDTREAIRKAATDAGTALSAWATNQAMVDALRVRMTELVTKRMALLSR